MLVNQKAFRYYYWIFLEFIKKHLRLIVVSFLLSIIDIISIISFSPYLINFASSTKEVHGLVGTPSVDDIPDTILSKISSGLVFVNEKGNLVPVVAEKWEQSKDGKTYKFFLRKNLYWNDGKKLTTDGIEYRFKDVTVKKINDYQLEFSLSKPLPIFPTYLTTPIVKKPFVGVAGLYKVDRFKIQYGQIKELYLSPNKSNLPILVYKFYDTESKMIEAYKLGEINTMEVTKKAVADLFKTWSNTTIERTVDYSRLMTLFFNMNNEFLKEKDNRKAIANAIRRDFFDEQGVEADSPIPPISWAYNSGLKKVSYDYDLALKVLNKNYDATTSGELQLDTYYDYLDTAEEVKDSLDKVGLKVKLNTLSFAQQRPFDLLLAFWRVPLDPDQYFFWHSTQKQGNIVNYNNVKIDKLLEDGRSTTPVDERKEIYNEFQRTIMDDLPAYFLFYPYTYTIRRK